MHGNLGSRVNGEKTDDPQVTVPSATTTGCAGWAARSAGRADPTAREWWSAREPPLDPPCANSLLRRVSHRLANSSVFASVRLPARNAKLRHHPAFTNNNTVTSASLFSLYAGGPSVSSNAHRRRSLGPVSAPLASPSRWSVDSRVASSRPEASILVDGHRRIEFRQQLAERLGQGARTRPPSACYPPADVAMAGPAETGHIEEAVRPPAAGRTGNAGNTGPLP